MTYTTAVLELKRALLSPLPGAEALALMAPRTPVGEPLRGREAHPGAHPAAGLVVIYPDAHQNATFLLTERSPHLPAHPGQISLPGGMQAPGETLEQTACREAEEEVGIDANAVLLLGALSPVYIPPSNILLHAFVGHLKAAPSLRALPREVTRMFEIPLSALLARESIHEERRQLSIGEAIIPYFHISGVKIWGATAILLAELRALLMGSRQS